MEKRYCPYCGSRLDCECEGKKYYLTYEEAEEKADKVWWYKDGVFKYKEGGKWTLIENGKVLITGVADVYWRGDGVFKYREGGKWTLIKDGKVLIAGVDEVCWHEDGVFKYREGGKYTLIRNGKVLIEDVDGVLWWYEDGAFKYEKDGEWRECKIIDGYVWERRNKLSE